MLIQCEGRGNPCTWATTTSSSHRSTWVPTHLDGVSIDSAEFQLLAKIRAKGIIVSIIGKIN